MPRLDRNRSLPIPYRPNNPPGPGSTPEQSIRAIWTEFTRIAAALTDLDRPLSLAVSGTDTINVGATASYLVMLDASPTVTWQEPGGTFDPLTGTWTCSSEGVFAVNVSVVSNPFPAPATKSYSVNVRLTRTPFGGAPVVYSFAGGGLDDQFVTAVGSFLLALQQGDTLQVTAAGVHATKTGTNTVTTTLNLTRQSGTGDGN